MTGLTHTAVQEVANLLVRGFSAGRRQRVVLDMGAECVFQTDLHSITVPLPAQGTPDIRVLSIALVLQCSPTKEAVASLRWDILRKSEQQALAWIEGEHAVRWARAAWPGLLRDLNSLFPWVDERPLADTAQALLEETLAQVSGLNLGEPPTLFGRLPLPMVPVGTLRSRLSTAIGSKWTMRQRIRRNASMLAIPMAGPSGESVTLPGEAGDLEALMGGTDRHLGIPYDEWDYRKNRYRYAYTRVIELGDIPAEQMTWPPAIALPKFMPVRRRFRRCDQGDLDIDAVVSWRCDAMTGTAIDDPRWFAQLTPVFRPIAFALLIDASASSISGRGSFLRKGVAQANALTAALSAEGHCVAAFSFCSRSHERVEVRLLKEFSEPYVPFGHSIKPAGYTRLGAAIRHVGQRLSLAPAEARILLTFGDGVPSDEGYDGRYGQMDVAKAIEEQRQAGVLVRHLLPEARSDTHSNDTLDAVFGPFGWMSVESLAELHQVMTTLAYEVRG